MSHFEPVRVRPERRLPADWSLPGHCPAQEASWAALGSAAVFVLPVLAFLLVKRWCAELQETERVERDRHRAEHEAAAAGLGGPVPGR